MNGNIDLFNKRGHHQRRHRRCGLVPVGRSIPTARRSSGQDLETFGDPRTGPVEVSGTRQPRQPPPVRTRGEVAEAPSREVIVGIQRAVNARGQKPHGMSTMTSGREDEQR